MDEEMCFHVMSRVVQRRFLIDEKGMEEMRRILRTQAAFAGLDVITFCFLKNHFHILLHIDPLRAREEVTDGELVSRFRALYGGKRSPSLGVDAETLETLLAKNSPRAAELRRKLLARMGDLSVFMRELKTRFTFWYNKHYKTVGTFWAERYRRVFVEPGSAALRTVAAYIDLNAVRAGLADSPGEYRFCGLGEALGGGEKSAYDWLMRRKKGRGRWELVDHDVFGEYVAHVKRLTAILKAEKAGLNRLKKTGTVGGNSGLKEAGWGEGYGAKGGAVGSASWVERLCEIGGMLGFLRKRRPIALNASVDEPIYAARRWHAGD
ncbi:MAG: transposase [Opitutales bacterium]|nr:transposase [Opitutales bacterium]